MRLRKTREKRTTVTAFSLLVIPVCVYILLFLIPITGTVALSFDNRDISSKFYSLNQAVTHNNSSSKDRKAKALLEDLEHLTPRERGEIARVLNQEKTGFRSLFLKTSRGLEEIEPNYQGLIQFDQKWADPDYWVILEKNLNPFTSRYFDRILGRAQSVSQSNSSAEDNVYLKIMQRTLIISIQVTLFTLLIGYPLSYAVANGSKRFGSFILIIVLLSFWTSILVRTTAWLVLLQTNGVINSFLISLGFIEKSLQLIFNRFGTLVSITHVLLPFAIIPMINVMKTISKSQNEASRSLGAGGIESFLRVYFPQSLRGVFVGGGIVFILSLGFYITPALTGGPRDQMLAFYIADFVMRNLNWGMAAALSVVLLITMLALLVVLGIVRWVNARKWSFAQNV